MSYDWAIIDGWCHVWEWVYDWATIDGWCVMCGNDMTVQQWMVCRVGMGLWLGNNRLRVCNVREWVYDWATIEMVWEWDYDWATIFLYPPKRSLGGVYWIHPVRPSVCVSVCPSVRPSVRPWVGVRMITLILFSGFKHFFLHISLGSRSCMGLNISVLPH